MKISKKIVRNINIFLLAGVFSLALIFMIKHPNLLQASILNSSEISLIQKNKRDIAYKQNNNFIDVFCNWLYYDNSITLLLAHSESIFLDISNISWQCPFTIVDSNKNATKIILECWNIDKNQSIIIIPFEWLSKDILIEEAYYVKENKKNNLSIWNISLITEHSN